MREIMRNVSTAGKAKRLGKTLELRPDWEEIKVDIMEEVLRDKFSFRNVGLMLTLFKTGTEELVEGNSWGDKIWGRVFEDGEWKGFNHLGILLHIIRGDIQRRFDIEELEMLHKSRMELLLAASSFGQVIYKETPDGINGKEKSNISIVEEIADHLVDNQFTKDEIAEISKKLDDK